MTQTQIDPRRYEGLTQPEKQAFFRGHQAAKEIPLSEMPTIVDQYAYFPYSRSPRPACTLNEAAMWARCPDVSDMPRNEALTLRAEYERIVRARFQEAVAAGQLK
jgi:hypothetical protein